MNDYPYIQCLDPQRIYNKYIGEEMIVECGCCAACLNRKASRNALKCRLESTQHQYTMFVTLTYNQINVPLMRHLPSTRIMDYEAPFMELTERLGIGTVLGYDNLDPYNERRLLTKCKTFDLFPHLSKRDLQLFMKRLRKYLSKYSNEKIRFYAVGEYGPVHYRPHYHLLLWFSDVKIFEIIQQAVSACWRYGRVRTEIPRGDCAQYVAKYVAGNHTLPRVFMLRETRPFALHSYHLGEGFLQKEKEKVYQLTAREFNERSVNLGKDAQKFVVWRSFKTFYFPKCKGYAFLNDDQLYYVYRLYFTASDWTKKTCVAAIARYILRTILGVIGVYGNTEQFHSDPDINDLLMYFYKSCDINYCAVDDYDDYFMRIYNELRLSKHFLMFVCDGDLSPEKSKSMIERIKQYWNECDYNNLLSQLESMEQLDFTDEEDFQYYYHNIDWTKDIIESKKYIKFCADSKNRSEMSIKHKKLNDLNKIFIY